MERLEENALIYGRLMPITAKHSIERYNAALVGLGLPKTKLKKFRIDAAGYSPEVATEMNDEHYLDPHQVNRRFIILSPEQSDLPIVNQSFSSTRDMMQLFFRENAQALHVLTLKDVVFGEIEDSTYRVDELDDILSIRSVQFKLNTANELLDAAEEQEDLIKDFLSDEDSWKNNALMDELLRLANLCGDTRHNGIVPDNLFFKKKSFWTSHFKGIFVFQEKPNEAIVVGKIKAPAFVKEARALKSYISLQEHGKLVDFLFDTGRLESVNELWLRETDLVSKRLDLYVRKSIAEKEADVDLNKVDEIWQKNWIHRNIDDLSKDKIFTSLLRINKRLLNGDKIGEGHLSSFEHLLISRANLEHEDAMLVNRLLSALVPFDVLWRFVVDKDAFYLDYADYPENLRDYVVDLIKSQYIVDKRAFRAQLFSNWRLNDA